MATERMAPNTAFNAAGRVAAPALSTPRRSLWARLGEEARRRPLGAVALVLVLLITGASAFAPWLAPFNPEAIYSDWVLVPPEPPFYLGTDDFGRDLLSRIMYGGRISLVVGICSVLIGVSLGTIIGITCGYFGGAYDTWVQRLMDALMAFPTLVLALALVAMLGISIQNIIVAIAIVLIPTGSRVVRAATLGIKHEQYVEAARTCGCTNLRIIVRHLAPNVFAPVLVLATASLGSAIVTEAALSFVGLGTPPPTPSWGQMMTGSARTYITVAPWLAFFPGLTLSLLVLGINLLGDTLRDILDPRLRNR